MYAIRAFLYKYTVYYLTPPKSQKAPQMWGKVLSQVELTMESVDISSHLPRVNLLKLIKLPSIVLPTSS